MTWAWFVQVRYIVTRRLHWNIRRFVSGGQ